MGTRKEEAVKTLDQLAAEFRRQVKELFRLEHHSGTAGDKNVVVTGEEDSFGQPRWTVQSHGFLGFQGGVTGACLASVVQEFSQSLSNMIAGEEISKLQAEVVRLRNALKEERGISFQRFEMMKELRETLKGKSKFINEQGVKQKELGLSVSGLAERLKETQALVGGLKRSLNEADLENRRLRGQAGRLEKGNNELRESLSKEKSKGYIKDHHYPLCTPEDPHNKRAEDRGLFAGPKDFKPGQIVMLLRGTPLAENRSPSACPWRRYDASWEGWAFRVNAVSGDNGKEVVAMEFLESDSGAHGPGDIHWFDPSQWRFTIIAQPREPVVRRVDVTEVEELKTTVRQRDQQIQNQKSLLQHRDSQIIAIQNALNEAFGEDNEHTEVEIIVEAAARMKELKENHDGACVTIASMHGAATGKPMEGPRRGLVEDVADLKQRFDNTVKMNNIVVERYHLLMAAAAPALHALQTIAPIWKRRASHSVNDGAQGRLVVACWTREEAQELAIQLNKVTGYLPKWLGGTHSGEITNDIFQSVEGLQKLMEHHLQTERSGSISFQQETDLKGTTTRLGLDARTMTDGALIDLATRLFTLKCSRNHPGRVKTASVTRTEDDNVATRVDLTFSHGYEVSYGVEALLEEARQQNLI